MVARVYSNIVEWPPRGGGGGVPTPPLVPCLSERSVVYEDTPTPYIWKVNGTLFFLGMKKVSESPSPAE